MTKSKQLMMITVICLMLIALSVDAHQLYNPMNSFCCANTVFPNKEDPHHRRTACCGSTIFDPWTELCCDGNVTKSQVTPGATDEANQNDTVADEGPADSRPPMSAMSHYGGYFGSFMGPTHACCKDKTFDFTKEICCEGIVHTKPIEDKDNPYPTYYSCCKDQLFNASGQDCCNSKILNRTKMSESCCGDKIIDFQDFICCSSGESDEQPVAHPRDTMAAGCCGLQKIDYEKEACCLGKVLPLPEDPELKSLALCCGEQLIQNNAAELCCAGKTTPRTSEMDSCCNTTIYQSDKQICCNDKIYPLYSNSTYCCGDIAYDERKECCLYSSMEIVPLGDDPEKTACC